MISGRYGALLSMFHVCRALVIRGEAERRYARSGGDASLGNEAHPLGKVGGRGVRLTLVLMAIMFGIGNGSWLSPKITRGAAEPDLTAVSVVENDCAFLIQFDDDPRPLLGDITCGWLDVPENWADPDGRRIQLGYVVLQSTSADPALDPVIYLDGGPGGSPLTGVLTFAELFSGLRASRDVVLFDQRGTRHSSELRCPMLGGSQPDLAGNAADAPPPALLYPAELVDPYEVLQQARQDVAPMAAACAREIAANGVDLRQYNSIASANDTVALIEALGYDTFNLYGLSYGTRLALVVMRDHPASGIRSVVLDSSFPPQINGFERYPEEFHEVVVQLFADCALDRACHAAYPDLTRRFMALLDALAERPLVTAEGEPIDDRDLVQLMQRLSGLIPAVPLIPRMIAELEQGETATFAAIASGELTAAPAEATPEPPGEAPEADAAAATPIAAEADLPAAADFLDFLQQRIETLPDDEADALVAALLGLDAQPRERESLVALVEGLFPDDPEARGELLDLLTRMDEDDVQEVFTVVADRVSLLDFLTFGMTLPQFNSVECNEEIPFQAFEETVAVAQGLAIPELALGVVQAMANQFAICEVWPSGRAPGFENAPVHSDVPTLILAGAYDVQTPVSWNKSAFVTLPNALFVEAPMSGHGVITYSDCAGQIVAAFIADPAVPPDTACTVDLMPDWALPPATEIASSATMALPVFVAGNEIAH